MSDPVPVEPSCTWRMLTNGWTYDQITRELHITGPAVKPNSCRTWRCETSTPNSSQTP